MFLPVFDKLIAEKLIQFFKTITLIRKYKVDKLHKLYKGPL